MNPENTPARLLSALQRLLAAVSDVLHCLPSDQAQRLTEARNLAVLELVDSLPGEQRQQIRARILAAGLVAGAGRGEFLPRGWHD
jgi:hypothetical protein